MLKTNIIGTSTSTQSKDRMHLAPLQQSLKKHRFKITMKTYYIYGHDNKKSNKTMRCGEYYGTTYLDHKLSMIKLL